MSLIPANFVTSYNGFVFDPPTTVTTRLNCSPKPTRDGRSIAYNEYTIGLRCLMAGQPNDFNVARARALLSKSGGQFRYGGRGLGSIYINTAYVRDVQFGPKPRVLAISPKGPNACFIDWEVTVCIPECNDAKFMFAPMDLAYSMEFQIRSDGRQNRVTSGTLMIPNNRTFPYSTAVFDNPDRYRDSIPPPLPPGFRREWGPFNIDQGRTTLSFSWTDKEFGRNILPPGVVSAKASQTVGSDNSAFVNFLSTITASYTMAAGYEPALANKYFKDLVFDRLGINQLVGPGAGRPGKTIIVRDFRMTDPDLYADESRADFSFTFQVMNSSLAGIISDSGLWQQTGQDWRTWATSLQNSALNPRGYSRLEFSPNDDEIVDLCNTPQGRAPVGIRREEAFANQQHVNILGAGWAIPAPQAQSSWIEYKNYIRVETDPGTVVQQTLATVKPSDATPQGPEVQELRNDPNSRLGPITGTTPYPMPADSAYDRLMGAINAKLAGAKPKITSARRTNGRIVVFMIGWATRAGFAIPVPVLKAAGGIVPILANRLDKGEGFVTGILENKGVPIVGARWNLRYVLPQMPPGGIEPPPDPTKETQ